MKKILSTVMAIALFVGAAQAQNTEENSRPHGEKKGVAMEQLNLTADQKAKLQSIREAQHKELQDLRKNGQLTTDETKAKRKELQEKYKSQFRSVLTPAQLEELKKNKSERGGKDFGKKGDHFKNGAAFTKELNLSPEQETRMNSISEEFRSKAQAIHSNSSLTQDQQKEQLHALAKQLMEQRKALLTPDQQKKFEELKAKRKHQKNKNL